MYKVGDLVRVKESGKLFNVVAVSGLTSETVMFVADDWYWYKADDIELVTHLTTKESIKLVEDMGYRVDKLKGKLHVMKDDFTSLAFVSSERLYDIDTMQMNRCSKKLFELLTLYARTPLELREEKEELFTLELPNNNNKNRFYCHNKETNDYSFKRLNKNVNNQVDHLKYFTQKEIDELPNRELIKALIKKEVKEKDNEK